MNKGERFIIIFIGLIVLSAGLSLASFSYKSNNLATQYSAGGTIEGTINMSITNEYADSIFTSNFNGSITLINLLEANNLVEGSDYNCTHAGCGSIYKDSGIISSSVGLTTGTPLIVGFMISGEDVGISSLKFSVSSDAGNSCSRQILIDMLDKNESFIQSNEPGGLCGEREYGCINAATSNPAVITTTPYCEKISLDSAPAYQLGAVITNGTKSDSLIMSLRTLEGDNLDNCVLPPQAQTTQELTCNVNYTLQRNGDYLVCISSYAPDSEYAVASESTKPVCGSANGQLPYNTDFYVFAQPLEFAAINTLNINDTLFSNQNFEDLVYYVNNYLDETYNHGNCSNGCFIPFKFTGGISQSLTFSNAKLVFSRNGVSTYDQNLRKLDIDKSTIKTPTNKPVNLEISHAGFKIPIGSTAKQLYLYLNGVSILSKPLSISISPSFAFDISPKTISFGALTNFQAITTANITSSTWNFGDGITKTVSGKTISHRYTTYDPDGYTVIVELTRKDGIKAPASFDVSFRSLSESANSLLNEYDIRIANLSKEINSFSSISPFISSSLRNGFNITTMQNSLNASRRMLANASTNEEYIAVINSALLIDPPASLEISEKGVSIPLEFGFGSMDVKPIKDISPASASSDEDLKKAISSWFDKNYDAKIDYDILSRTDDDNEKTPVLTDFRISITKKTGADASANDAHLIIGYPRASIVFADAGNYSAKPAGSGTDIPITGSTNAPIEFSINGDIGISTLGMYISPKIDKLGSYGAVEVIAKTGFNWGKFILWFGILLVVALAIYVALQQWYKKRYESYLFKNSADLYNIITFIYNSRKAGLDNGEIGRKLRKANWKGEQVAYAFRKINGERTGMPALPFFGSFEKKKIMEEIEKRKQPAQPEPSQIKQNIY